MVRIEVRLTEIGEDIQNESIAAFLVLKDKEFLLDSELLNTGNEEDDLEILESFCIGFENLADVNDIEIEFEEEINQRIVELNIEIDMIEENEKVDEEKTMKRCQD
jgi:hypothetical protein